MRCSSCDSENHDGAKFCVDCGVPLAARCPSCDVVWPAMFRFCPECGAAAPGTPDATAGHVAGRIGGSQEALEGERKDVTVLFVDVQGSMDLAVGMSAEAWSEIMQGFFRVLAEGVERFGGVVDKFTGDGIMALFGAPVAHEDHAQRACYAALHLRDQVERFAAELKHDPWRRVLDTYGRELR